MSIWRRIGNYLKCLLPMLGYFGAVVLGTIVLMLFQLRTFGLEGLKVFDENIIVVQVVADIFCILLMGLWYRKTVRRKIRPQDPRNVLGMKDAGILLLLAFGLQLLTAILTGLEQVFYPDLIEEYEKMMEATGLTGNGPLVFLDLVIFAPIAEELTMRGLTMHYARKAGLSFWAANVVQALLFALMHQNLIQISYAFFPALLMGWLCKKYHSLYAPILLHMLFNALSDVIPFLSLVPLPAPVLYTLYIVVGVPLVFFTIRWIQKNKSE